MAVYATLSADAYEAHVRRASLANVSAETVDALWGRRPTIDADDHIWAMADATNTTREPEATLS